MFAIVHVSGWLGADRLWVTALVPVTTEVVQCVGVTLSSLQVLYRYLALTGYSYLAVSCSYRFRYRYRYMIYVFVNYLYQALNYILLIHSKLIKYLNQLYQSLKKLLKLYVAPKYRYMQLPNISRQLKGGSGELEDGTYQLDCNSHES